MWLCFLYFGFINSDTLSALEGVGGVSCVEIKSELTVITGQITGVNVLRHPVVASAHLGNEEGSYKFKVNTVI